MYPLNEFLQYLFELNDYGSSMSDKIVLREETQLTIGM